MAILSIAKAARRDLVADKGKDWTRTWALTFESSGNPVPIPGVKFEMHIADAFEGTRLLTLTDGSGTSVDEGASTLTATITAAQLSGLASGDLVFDTELVKGAEREPHERGRFTLRGDA